MTSIREALLHVQQELSSAGIPDARLEGEVLLMAALQLPRFHIYSYPEQTLTSCQEEALSSMLGRRLRREPLAYIIGEKEFYGLSFFVSPGVFIPRPETELLVEKALDLAQGLLGRREPVIADVGTGCGAIAVSLAFYWPQAYIWATDISAKALEVARANAQRYGVEDRIGFLQGHLLEPLPHPVDLVLANLPYVPEPEFPYLQPEIRLYEPREALVGGWDGLEVYRWLLAQARQKLSPNGYLLLEMDPRQRESLLQLSRYHFPGAQVEVGRDLAGWERVLMVKLLS